MSEQTEQIVVADYLSNLGADFIHVPSEGARRRSTGAVLKLMGWSKGFPDLLIFGIPGRDVKGVALEMKDDDEKLDATDEQKEWLHKLSRWGFVPAVACGADAAVKFLRGVGYVGIQEGCE